MPPNVSKYRGVHDRVHFLPFTVPLAPDLAPPRKGLASATRFGPSVLRKSPSKAVEGTSGQPQMATTGGDFYEGDPLQTPYWAGGSERGGGVSLSLSLSFFD